MNTTLKTTEIKEAVAGFPCEVREVMACNYSTNTRFIREMDAWSCEDCYAWLKGVA